MRQILYFPGDIVQRPISVNIISFWPFLKANMVKDYMKHIFSWLYCVASGMKSRKIAQHFCVCKARIEEHDGLCDSIYKQNVSAHRELDLLCYQALDVESTPLCPLPCFCSTLQADTDQTVITKCGKYSVISYNKTGMEKDKQSEAVHSDVTTGP
jgi:hypothetical protein